MSSVIVKVSGYLIMVRYVFDVFFYMYVCVCVLYETYFLFFST